MLKIYNTLSKKVENFEPLNPPSVTLYTCGPTVYWNTHIGHMSKYVRDDVLKRTLILNGYKVNHVMNVTDVGHLESDADEGEDKMEKGAKRENVTVWDLARKYEKEFFDTMDALNVLRPNTVCRATENIEEQVNLIKKLEEKGYTYATKSAVLFDVSKFPSYTELSGQKLSDKMVGVRDDVVIDKEKKHPYDFVLWFKRVGRYANHVMHWDSPWGDGFPGWHIECSAMSMKYLNTETVDIHTGGEDHIGVHHPAEIAQSESATGKQFVRYWMHHAFITIEGQKMSKSLGNFYTLQDIQKKGYDPLSLRYLFLTAHYRSPLDFTFKALDAAQEGLNHLRDSTIALRDAKLNGEAADIEVQKKEFLDILNQDLQTPQALAYAWETLKSNKLNASQKLRFIYDCDRVFGFDLESISKILIPQNVMKLAEKRKELREEGNITKADEIREQIRNMGYEIRDLADGFDVRKIPK